MAKKHEIHNTNLHTARIGGETARAASGCPFDSINTISFNTMMKRE
jgi:hypothetical protein